MEAEVAALGDEGRPVVAAVVVAAVVVAAVVVASRGSDWSLFPRNFAGNWQSQSGFALFLLPLACKSIG